MRRAVLTLSLAAGFATRAAGQWLGQPVWNSPTGGGGGLTVSADYGKPNDNYGGGSAWGARLSVVLGTTTFTLGAANWSPAGPGETLTSVGGGVAFRLVGGTLLPTPSPGLRANLQLGVAHADIANLIFSPASATTVTGAVGVGAWLRAPGFTVEPYLSPGIRYRSASGGGNSTEFGYAIGANAGFGLLGVHLAYDTEQVQGGGSFGVFGVGVHLTP